MSQIMVAVIVLMSILQKAFAQPACLVRDLQVTNNNDIDAISSCTALQNVFITGTAIRDIRLPRLTVIQGSLIVERNSQLVSLQLPALRSVQSTLALINNTVLRQIDFSKLVSANEFRMQINPGLDQLDLASGLRHVSRLLLIDNAFKSISGLQLDRADSIELRSLSRLSDVAMNELKTVSGSLMVTLNSPALNVEMKQLQSVGDKLSLTHVQSIQLPHLASIANTLSVSETRIGSLELPRLSSIGQDLIIRSNDAMQNISFASLKSVEGTIFIQNNTDMGVISFPALDQVHGSINILNDLTRQGAMVDLTALRRLDGELRVEGHGVDCSAMAIVKSVAVNGEYHCSSNGANHEANDSTATTNRATTSTTDASPGHGNDGPSSHVKDATADAAKNRIMSIMTWLMVAVVLF